MNIKKLFRSLLVLTFILGFSSPAFATLTGPTTAVAGVPFTPIGCAGTGWWVLTTGGSDTGLPEWSPAFNPPTTAVPCGTAGFISVAGTYWLWEIDTGLHPAIVVSPAPPAGLTIGSAGTNWVAGSSGTGTGVLGAVAGAGGNFSVSLVTLLGAVIAIGLAYLVLRFGWKRVKKSTS